MELDVTKAFDMLEWLFLVWLLQKIGFGPKFLAFIQAIHMTATSVVRVNGQLSKYFKNARSVRQGCPLSPLLFIIAMDALSCMLQDALSCMLQQALDVGSICGVIIDPLGQQALHSLFLMI
jgi:hypothetical protein